MISLSNVTRVYEGGATAVHALRGVSFTISSGEYVAIMGPSGSGKSTLLNMLGCLDRPTSGLYQFEGRDVGGLSEGDLAELRQKRIGFVFQFFHLVPRLSAHNNVDLPMVFAGIEPAARKTRVKAALDRVHLGERSSHRPSQLSGGERQRVAIARAIVMEPALLLADEPTGNLDRHTGWEIIELLEDMNRHGLTLVIVTHDAEIGRRAKRCIRIADGSIESDAPQ
ncbi:MAG: ABC transporter ATP-binding protein [Candidatus Hydrogenedentota bacterium]